ncbi:hypothetical protein [Agromyces humi]|uniref:hypothetical protein n=1 Tax=Agromyces humi TaxID=1766800 RepID=UPI00135930A4|nr:hypothetical protein [Agromyces humi]
MTDPTQRPALLQDAKAAIAYERWLAANGFTDSDLNAWRFAAEAGTPEPNSSYSSTADAPERKPRVRWWIPVAIVAGSLAAVAAFAVFAVTSAHHWTKVDIAESSHIEQVPDGTWHVSMDDKNPCYVGQAWIDCINEHVNDWNYSCAELSLDQFSKGLCDRHYDMTQKMKADGASNEWAIVETLGGWGRLSRSENTDSVKVIDQPEVSHEAVCYLGFLGECEPQPEEAPPNS